MIGFVILNYNSWELTEELVRTLEKYNNINKIAVVDNMSTDNSYEHLITLKNDKVEVIQSGKNGGYSYGNNVGAKVCKENGTDIIFICNPDVSIKEEQLDKIISAFEEHEKYAILSGVEYNIKNQLSKPPIWKLNTYWDDLFDCFLITRMLIKKKKQEHIDKSQMVQGVDIIKGSFFGIRTDIFFDIGGFDEGVFLFCEERILAKKLLTNGYKLGIVTSAKYNHNHSESINKAYKRKATQMKLLYKSRYYYNVKYNHIGILKKITLKVAMAISCLEFKVRDAILQWKSR